MNPVTVRFSTDADSIRDLTSLDGSPPPRVPVMLAELDGSPVAAVGIADGKAVVDPSRSTSAITTLLRIRRIEARMIAAIWGV